MIDCLVGIADRCDVFAMVMRADAASLQQRSSPDASFRLRWEYWGMEEYIYKKVKDDANVKKV
jgi:hypothetical protein